MFFWRLLCDNLDVLNPFDDRWQPNRFDGNSIVWGGHRGILDRMWPTLMTLTWLTFWPNFWPFGRLLEGTQVEMMLRTILDSRLMRGVAIAICRLQSLYTMLCFLVLVPLGFAELLFYLTFLLLIAASWGVIYYELWKAISRRFSPFNQELSIGAHLKRLARHHIHTASAYSASRAQFDLVGPVQPAPLSAALERVEKPWRALEQLKTAQLLPIALALESILEERPNASLLFSTSFKLTIYEMAGIFSRYLLPLPCLKHLFRPFRLAIIVPFLMTYPVFLLSMYTTGGPGAVLSAGPAPTDNSLASFDNAAFAVVAWAHWAGLTASQASKLLHAQLRVYTTHRAAVQAEKRAHEAILDAVLGWKAYKLELERERRNKQNQKTLWEKRSHSRACTGAFWAWLPLAVYILYVVVYYIPKSLSTVALEVAVVMHQVELTMLFTFFLALFVFEVTAYLSIIALVIGTCSVIVCEFRSTFRRSNRDRLATKRAFAHVRKVTALTSQEMVLSAKLASAEAYFDEAAAHLSYPSRLPSLSSTLDSLCSSWDSLVCSDARTVETSQAQLYRLSQWSSGCAAALCVAGVDALQDHINVRRGFYDAITFKSTVYELAGIAIRTFRLPRLQHLARPWRLEPFLLFLLTYPAYKCLTRYSRRSRHPPFYRGLLSKDTVAKPFAENLTEMDICWPFISLQTLRAVVTAALTLQHGTDLVSKAERLSHNAILDAVLDWKLSQLEAQWEREP
ncbi:hypothetical protein JCM10207_007367 [Rhodosporidiobolus poonsookiae]